MTHKLAAVGTVRIERELFDYTHDMLRDYSSADVESMALWAGRLSSANVFDVLAVQVPRQQAIKTEAGLAVIVEGDELHRLNVWLFRHQLRLIAQLHTHPGSAYHSDTDDAIPIMAARGGLSLVIPDFARGPAELRTYAVYRLGEDARWHAVDQQAVQELIQVIVPEGED